MTAESSLRSLRALREFAGARRARCGVCGGVLPPDGEHPHVFHVSDRKVVCACVSCGRAARGASLPAFRRIPGRVVPVPDLVFEAASWNALGVPIGVAFFVRRAAGAGSSSWLAVYPSPAGALEAPLPEGAWQAVIAENPLLASFEPDVEALLARRSASGLTAYRTPIDDCYRLVGLLRSARGGVAGGQRLDIVAARFFDELRERAARGTS